jgi:transcription elongation factor GreB
MSKAFLRDSNEDEMPQTHARRAPAGPNYMTPRGHDAIQAELKALLDIERPELVQIVAWAAGNGDRSENADYIYGKKRLREIDRRIRYLTKRLESAVVVDPAREPWPDRVYFGATVTIEEDDGRKFRYQIVGVDEIDAGGGRISWLSPLARAVMRAQAGDRVEVAGPEGHRRIEVIEIRYE